MALTMPRIARVSFDSNQLSDHNRSSVEETVQRIETSTRTATGRLRKNYVADKMGFSMSWTDLPGPDAATVDGHWGADSIIAFYKATPGEFNLSLDLVTGALVNYEVHFTDFSYSVMRRYQRFYYDISLSLEEI